MTLNDLTAIQILCTAIKEKFDVNRVYIFGSKARGDDKQYSDINLLIFN
ncbi:nucleotidyltransferase domain-containing protein [Priestia megaterium]